MGILNNLIIPDTKSKAVPEKSTVPNPDSMAELMKRAKEKMNLAENAGLSKGEPKMIEIPKIDDSVLNGLKNETKAIIPEIEAPKDEVLLESPENSIVKKLAPLNAESIIFPGQKSEQFINQKAVTDLFMKSFYPEVIEYLSCREELETLEGNEPNGVLSEKESIMFYGEKTRTSAEVLKLFKELNSTTGKDEDAVPLLSAMSEFLKYTKGIEANITRSEKQIKFLEEKDMVRRTELRARIDKIEKGFAKGGINTLLEFSDKFEKMGAKISDEWDLYPNAKSLYSEGKRLSAAEVEDLSKKGTVDMLIKVFGK